MLGFHIYVGFMEGNPCFFRINACFTTFCDPITSGCQGFQEWIALYSTSNKLVQAQTRASPNEDEIGYQYTHKRRVLFWIGKHPASRITFQKSKKPKIRLISQELSVFVPDQSTFSYLVAFLPPASSGVGKPRGTSREYQPRVSAALFAAQHPWLNPSLTCRRKQIGGRLPGFSTISPCI